MILHALLLKKPNKNRVDSLVSLYGTSLSASKLNIKKETQKPSIKMEKQNHLNLLNFYELEGLFVLGKSP